MDAAIADTGPLVAFLDRSERHHGWVAARITELQAPLLACEPVLAEAMYLLARLPRAQEALFGLLENGAAAVALLWTSTLRRCAAFTRSTVTGRCRSPMPASCGWPNSMIGTWCSRSIPTSKSIANTVERRSPCFIRRRGKIASPTANCLWICLRVSGCDPCFRKRGWNGDCTNQDAVRSRLIRTKILKQSALPKDIWLLPKEGDP